MDRIIDHIKESVNDTRMELQAVLNRRLDLSLDTLARDLTDYVRAAVANHIRDLTRESSEVEDNARQQQQQRRVNNKSGSKRPLKVPRVRRQKAPKNVILSTESNKKHQQQRQQQQNKDRGGIIPKCTPSTSGLNSIHALPSTSRGQSGQGSSSASSKLTDEEEEEEEEEDYTANYDEDDDSSDSEDDDRDDGDDASEVDQVARTVRQDRAKSNASMAIQGEQQMDDTANATGGAVPDHVRDLARESTTNGQPSEEFTRQMEIVNQNNSTNNNNNNIESKSDHESEAQSVDTDQPAGTVPPPIKESTTIKSEPIEHKVGPFLTNMEICHCPHSRGRCAQDANDQVKEESDEQQEDSAHQDRQQQQLQPRVNKAGSKRPLNAPRVMQKAPKKKNLSTESKKKHQQLRQQQNNDRSVTIPKCTPSTSGLNSSRGQPAGQGSSKASHRSKLMDEEEEQDCDDENDEDYNAEDDDSSDSDDDYSDDDGDSVVDDEVALSRTIRQDRPKSNGSMAIQREQMDTANATGGEISNRSTSNPIQPNPSQPNPNSRFQCSHCPKSFGTSRILRQHEQVHRDKRFRCGQCRKRFTRKDQLGSHMRTHSGERPYECAHCEMKFSARSTRIHHEQAIHLHVKPYRCKQCGHTATNQTHIITHIRTVHFGLPRTVKQQHELNIVDNRDPKKLLEKV